ncbi:unnamed protein product [Cylicostephanus goldi]|uniref:G-protein coupled receptors family 1 profile domain-containing protein n=1 Tax=Cylicostephanus goldi TaxID=71465 RepID=A0A3P7R443_CYLGO|nr:unnamed protein product [Cylicostephanus goldi]
MARDHSPLPNIILTICICAFGIFGNSMIILATITSKKLRGRCNVLICMLAVSDLFCCVYLIHLRVMMLCGWYIQRTDLCYWHSIYGLLALNAGSALGLILGIDRFLAVFWPMRLVDLCKNLPFCRRYPLLMRSSGTKVSQPSSKSSYKYVEDAIATSAFRIRK